jgi:hypothetical protein
MRGRTTAGTADRSRQHLLFTGANDTLKSQDKPRPHTSTGLAATHLSLQTTPAATPRLDNQNGSEGRRHQTPMTSRSRRQDLLPTSAVKRRSSAASLLSDPALPERVMFRRYRHVYAGKGGWYGNHCSRFMVATGHTICCDKCRRAVTNVQTARTVKQDDDSRHTSSATEQQPLSLCLRGIAVLPVAAKNNWPNNDHRTQYQRETSADEICNGIGLADINRRQSSGGRRDRKTDARNATNNKNDNNNNCNNIFHTGGKTAIDKEQLPVEQDTDDVHARAYNQVNQNDNSVNRQNGLNQSVDNVEPHPQHHECERDQQVTYTPISRGVECRPPLEPDDSVECFRDGRSLNMLQENDETQLGFDDVIGCEFPVIPRCRSASTFSSLLSREGRQAMEEIRREQRRTNVSPDSMFVEQQQQQASHQSTSIIPDPYQDDLFCTDHHSNGLSSDCNLPINDEDGDNGDVTEWELSRAMRKCSEWLNKRT